jgi:hypothetical protein
LKAAESWSATSRANTSAVPPAAKVLTSLTGLVGQLLCAAVGVAKPPATMHIIRTPQSGFMSPPGFALKHALP